MPEAEEKDHMDDMPKVIELKDPDGGVYKICSMYEDMIEKQSPVLWFGACAFFQLTHLGNYPEDKARDRAMAMLKEWVSKPCPIFLLSLFSTNSKKEQEKLLRGKSITPEHLICWILQSGRYGGLFSQYSYDAGTPQDLKGRAPVMIDASKPERIKTIGKTNLSDAALLNLVENQKRVISQFVDFPDGRWYCFYRTFRGLSGREAGKQGQHLHFISFAYGLSRDALVEGFMKGKCPGNGLHVHLSGYWENEMEI